MMFIRRVAILLATALFLQPGVSTMAADKSDFVQRTDEPASAHEQDILETVAKHTLGVQVKTKDGFWKPAKYGDPKLAEAVEHLAFIPKPWTVSSVSKTYRALKGKNDQACADLLRVLAASRDPRAAAVLGPALSDGSLSIRVAATYGIMDYFMNHTVNGGTEQHMEAASKWWQQQQADAGTSSGYHIGSDGWRPSSTGNRAAIRKYEDWVAKTTVSEWHFWKSGRLATVRIEKQLYKSSRDQYFYVHVAIKNTSNRIIAVDMKKPHRLIYPNQWTANDQGQRNLVDERRKITQAVDMAIDAELQTAFRSGGLSRIQPGGEISYFVNFNGCDSAKVDREKDKFIVVSMDGQLWLTDGTSTETIAKNADDISGTDFCIPLPIKWRNLPEDATVVM